MPRVTEETVDHVARLAHLSLTAEERSTFARQLSQVLEYAESIQALDTSAVEPMSHAAAGRPLPQRRAGARPPPRAGTCAPPPTRRRASSAFPGSSA